MPTHLVASLKSCAERKDLHTGIRLHECILQNNSLLCHAHVGNALISMFMKCGAIAKALQVFKWIPDLDAVSWNALIAGYTQHGYGNEALACFDRMRYQGFSPNSVTFVSTLKACGLVAAIGKGREIHVSVMYFVHKHDAIGNALVDMYGKCGLFNEAQAAFDGLHFHDVVSWTSLIAGYMYCGHGIKALRSYEQMQMEGVLPNAVTFVCIVKACCNSGVPKRGKEIHAMISGEESWNRNIVLGNALVDMYAKCGLLVTSQDTFLRLPVRDVTSWTSLIMGYVLHGHSEKALDYFKLMKVNKLSPNAITFSCILKACGCIGTVDIGRQVHETVTQEGLLEDINIANALVYMYVKCGFVSKARNVFDEILNPDVISWNILIAGYVQHGFSDEALSCFKKMQQIGCCQTAVTFACGLKACGNAGAMEEGERMHMDVVKHGFLETDLEVGNTLLDMYVKFALLGRAQTVFDTLPRRDVVSWNALISGCTQYGHEEEAIQCFELMQLEGQVPHAVTYILTLKSCGRLVAACKGKEIHSCVIKQGWVGEDVHNALIDMYASCGMLIDAKNVFSSLRSCSISSWTSLIAGFAQSGEDWTAYGLFVEMLAEINELDSVAFTIFLNLCSHSGFTQAGLVFFEIVTTVFGVIPALENYIGLIDLFGRAGQLEVVVSVIEGMPFCANATVWHTVMGSCQKWGNVELGIAAFHQLDVPGAAACVCLRNMHAATGNKEKTIE